MSTKGFLENTMIIVLSDHGQSFWKHSIHTHSLQVYDDTIKIPLIIKFPQTLQIKSHKIDNLVETIDILPTLLDLYSINPSEALPGKSLKNCLLINKCDNKNFVTSRNESTSSTLYALRDLNYKFIMQRYKKNEELYSMVADPDEKQNIANKNPIISEYFFQMLQKTFSDSQKYHYFSPAQSHLNGEIMEKLKALGYVD